MRRILIPAVAFAMLGPWFAPSVQAQARQGRMAPGLDEQMVQLTERLALDSDQVPQVRAVLEAQAEKRRDALQSLRGSGDRAAMRATMEEIQQETRTFLTEILSEEQLEKYDAFVEEMGRRRRPPPR